MKRSQKAILVFSSAAALLATGIGAIPSSLATISPIDQLRAQRAALVVELAAMQPLLNSRGGALDAAERAYNDQQQKVLAMQAHLDSLNKQMLTLSRQLTDDQATVAKDRHDLAQVIRATYETAGANQLLAAVLSASNFSQAMDRLKTANQVTQHVTDLVTQLAARDAGMRHEQAQIQKDLSQAQALEDQLSSARNRLLAIVLTRNSEFGRLSGPARSIAVRIATIDEEIAYLEAGPHVGNPTCGSLTGWAYGTCTWYVASRRCVPWGGNARYWYYNAAALGFKEGNLPVAGAVVVFWPGRDGADPTFGHVAYVEAVGPANNIPAGYFEISEMNATAGWDRVDYRMFANNDAGVQGFIY